MANNMIDSTGAIAVGAEASQANRARTLTGGAIGHFIEWFDWTIYGLLTSVFAAQMFPAVDALTSLILGYSAFALGFGARPIGSLVLSPLADRYGRRGVLSITILLAGLGSLLIALTPPYAAIGVAAPILVTVARLIQGFSAGGEFQIAVTFLNEHAPHKSRALSASPQMVSIGLAVLAATGVASLTTYAIPKEALTAWGWRLPFLLGAVISLYGLYLRRNLPETPAFERAAASRRPSFGEILASILEYPREALVVFVTQASTVQYYLWLIFLPTIANILSGLPLAHGLAATMIALIFYCLAVPIFAAMSDRIGRRPFLIGAAAGFLIFAYPLIALLKNPGFGIFLFVELVGVLFIAMNNAVIGTIFSELFPTRLRSSGIGIPYAICAAIFGGTAPIVATYFLKNGQSGYIALYVMAICLVSVFVHVFVTPETKDRPLD
jgi:MFS transporter, MHS family, alpha-ketoglutarate permease